MRNTMLRCCFRSRGQTWRPHLKLQEGYDFCLTLEKLGRPQPKTPIHCNNNTAVGIANNTIKWQQLGSIEM
jgi:hypothetical protein